MKRLALVAVVLAAAVALAQDPVGQSPSPDFWSGLTEAWHFDESSGNAVGAAKATVLVETGGSVVRETGVRGLAVRLVSVPSNTGYFVLTPDTTLNFDPAADWTVNYWFKEYVFTSGAAYAIRKADADATVHFTMGLAADTRPNFGFFDSLGSSNITAPLDTAPVGEWHNYTATFTTADKKTRFYKNGALLGTGAALTGVALGGSVGFYLNRRGTVNNTGAGDVALDELVFFVGTLKTTDWMLAAYNDGAGRSYPH